MSDFATLSCLMRRNRSYRRFDEYWRVKEEHLISILSNLKYAPSARNLQPLKYKMVFTEEECAKVFPHLKWAGYLKDWDGPQEGERPTAYLIQCLDTTLTESVLCDDGIHLLAITLGATALEYGCCIIKAFNAPAINEALGLPEHLKPMTVIAIGKPTECVVTEPMKGDEIEYWRDENQIHHVPKRNILDLMIR